MTALKTTVKDGKIELVAPADWPEGAEVHIEMVSAPGSIGIRDEHWPETPEGIARHLALMGRLVPPDITAGGRAEWEAARAAQRDFEKARFDDHAEALRKGWE